MPAGVELRPATAEDEAFLLAVYAGTREQELAVVPWDSATKGAFVRMQFAAQHSHYRQQFPGASFDVVTVNGVPAGRLYVDRHHVERRAREVLPVVAVLRLELQAQECVLRGRVPRNDGELLRARARVDGAEERLVLGRRGP